MLQNLESGKGIVLKFRKKMVKSSSKRQSDTMTIRIFKDIYTDEDTLFQEVKQLAKSILDGEYRIGKIRIYLKRIALFGYSDWAEFKIRFLGRLCNELEKEMRMDRQSIEEILIDKIEPIGEQ